MRHEIDLETVLPISHCLQLMPNETQSSILARPAVYFG